MMNRLTMQKTIRNNVSFFGIFKESKPYHFYAFQAVVFLYMFYRLASRDYTIYGLLDESYFQFPRMHANLWSVPFSYLTTFQFIYHWIPRPAPDTLRLLQLIGIFSCMSGFLGIFPRFCAWIVFVLGAHLTGFVQSSNADIEGGSLIVLATLILALARTGTHYNIFRSPKFGFESAHYHWPIFLFILSISVYYGAAGLNKLIDIGPHWPFILHLDWVGHSYIGHSFFSSNRYVHSFFGSILMNNPWFSVLGGLVTLISELFFILVLFVPKLRFFFIGSMIIMHILVFFSVGINFLGNSVLMLLCFDVNSGISMINRHSAMHNCNIDDS